MKRPVDQPPALGVTPPGDDDAAVDGPLHDRVYRLLRHALVTGRIVPGRAVTLRGLAQSLGVSPMPVREAIRRVSAEGGLVVGANRRVWVPAMDAERYEELIHARTLLEPELDLPEPEETGETFEANAAIKALAAATASGLPRCGSWFTRRCLQR
jgi:DNA-binding FadR family transcriptional regulator